MSAEEKEESVHGGSSSLYVNSVTGMETEITQLGMLFRFLPKSTNIGFFRAFSDCEGPGGVDSVCFTTSAIFQMTDPVEKMSAMSTKQALQMMASNQEDEMLVRAQSIHVEVKSIGARTKRMRV
eukprot:1891890-Pyramimonas_sp.AAC.1